MYETTPACFLRSGVMKMPLITTSHFFALSAGMRPGNAVLTGRAVSPHVFASADAMSTSKPVILPLVVASSIGGDGGTVQNLNIAPRAPPPAARNPSTTSRAPPPPLPLL